MAGYHVARVLRAQLPFYEGLGQIAQFQKILLNRQTCSTIAPYSTRDFAQLTRCQFFGIENDGEIASGLQAALAAVRDGHPAVVEVAIDYSVRTFFTKGVSATTFSRLPMRDRLEMIARIAGRRLFPGPAAPPPKVL